MCDELLVLVLRERRRDHGDEQLVELGALDVLEHQLVDVRQRSRDELLVLRELEVRVREPPVLDELAASYEGRMKVVKVNIDHNQKTPRNYNVRGIPTLMIFKNGKVEATQIGAVSKTQLTQLIDRTI